MQGRPVNRRSLLAASAGMLAAAGASKTAARPGPARNVLLIVADDQGRDLGCYNGAVQTPVLDRLAAEGVLFTEAYATVSSCSPSRSVIYTGLYSHTNGMYGLAHDIHNHSVLDWVVSLPQMMKAAGYATGLVCKKHVRPDSIFAYDVELAPEESGNRDVAHLAEVAGQFMRQQSGRPFFLTVAYSDPHRAPQDFGNKDWPKVKRRTYAPDQVKVPSHLPDLPEVRADLAAYYESISRLDSGIGLLLQELEAAGHAGDTLIIYLSDNGRAFPGGKTTLYLDGIHLPLIIKAPGGPRGVVNKAMVSWIDITPTILDFADAKGPPYPLPGRSLLPILGRSDADGWDVVYASHGLHEINQYYPMRAIRTRRYEYINNLAHELSYPIAGDVAGSPSWRAIEARAGTRLGKRTLQSYLHRPAEELYDTTTDPDEVINLAADPAHAKVLEDMRRRLAAWRAATHDPWLSGQTSPYAHLKN